MKEITIVTGPLRSGTSCVTGLLERCGFDLGRNIRILRNGTEFNPKGHFEPDLLYTINERLLVESPNGRWNPLCIPEEQAIAGVAAKRERYFQLFLRKFDGEVCKDPLFCLTLLLWEQRWPELRRAIFCLRHPVAVARSMHERYWITMDLGLELWQTYTSRFFRAAKRSQVFVFDFDAFSSTPVTVFALLLDWLGRPRPQEDIQSRLAGFFGSEHIHWDCDDADLQHIPAHIKDLYLEIRSSVRP
jgi:hypothetical protein